MTIDFSNKEDVTFDVIGPSEDNVSATDALFESGEKLFLSLGDVFIAKDLCPFDNALLLSLSFSVKDVSSVKVILLDRLSTEIDSVIVSGNQLFCFYDTLCNCHVHDLPFTWVLPAFQLPCQC